MDFTFSFGVEVVSVSGTSTVLEGFTFSSFCVKVPSFDELLTRSRVNGLSALFSEFSSDRSGGRRRRNSRRSDVGKSSLSRGNRETRGSNDINSWRRWW